MSSRYHQPPTVRLEVQKKERKNKLKKKDRKTVKSLRCLQRLWLQQACRKKPKGCPSKLRVDERQRVRQKRELEDISWMKSLLGTANLLYICHYGSRTGKRRVEMRRKQANLKKERRESRIKQEWNSLYPGNWVLSRQLSTNATLIKKGVPFWPLKIEDTNNLYTVRHLPRQRINPTKTFPLKYRQSMDSIWLFAECLSYSRMLFASPW